MALFIYEDQFFKSVIISFFWSGENYNSWILWYLLSCVYSLVFVFFMRKKKRQYKSILIIGMLIGLCAVFLDDYNHGLFECFSTIGFFLKKVSSLGARIVTGFFYIPCGLYLGFNWKREWKSSAKLICSSLIFGGLLLIISPGYGYVYEFGRAIATIAIVYILVSSSIRAFGKYSIFRELSSSLYYWHLWVYTILNFVVYGIGNMHKGLSLYIGTVLIIVGIFYCRKLMCKCKHYS